MAALFSTLATTAEHWTRHIPNHASLTAVLGNASASTRTEAASSLVSNAAHSPTVVAFQLTTDPTNIYIGYHPTAFPADLHNATAYDNGVLLMVGDDIEHAMGMVLQADAFGRTVASRFFNRNYINGANGYAAVPPVRAFELQAAGTAETDEYQCRRFAILPATVAAKCCSDSTDGVFTLDGFNRLILEPEIASADADRVAAIDGAVAFWRACHHHAAGHPDRWAVGSARIASATIADDRALQVRTNAVRKELLGKLGVGGPALSTAAFNTGVNAIVGRLERDNQNTLQYHRDKDNKSFTDRHGEQLAERVRRWCNVTDDAALPEIHRLLAKSDGKARDYGIIQSALEARVLEQSVLLSMVNAPMVTTAMVEEVFRQYQPCNPGLAFAKGLSPFAVVCHGHPEQLAVSNALAKARIATSGNGSLSLADATALITADVRFPLTCNQGAEQSYGWSMYIDLFHGPGHDVSLSVRNFVKVCAPVFASIQSANAEDQASGMDLICRVMYDAQQDYFSWMQKVGAGVVGTTVPTFENLIDRVLTHRTSGLSMLPSSWYLMIQRGAPQVRRSHESPAASTSGMAGVTRVPTFNTWADESVMKRFRESRFSTVSELLEASDKEEPKHGGKPVCLTWALKGTCSAKCKRGKQHVRYPAAVVKKLQQFLTDAGVTPSSD